MDKDDKMRVEPVRLEGERVVLEPMQFRHAGGLLEAAQDKSTWKFMPSGPLLKPEGIHWMIERALLHQNEGNQIPFVIVEKSTGRVAGSTRYLHINEESRNLEIGWTWLGKAWRRTGINTECKHMMLKHAFEALGAVRVSFKADARNIASHRAIERLGAVREGVLRKHLICWDGFVRDSVYFSIVDDEWPEVKRRLEKLLQ